MQVQSLDLLSGLSTLRRHELWYRSKTWLGSDIAVAVAQTSGYSSNLTPSLGTSICHRVALKKKKIQTEVLSSRGLQLERVYSVCTNKCLIQVRKYSVQLKCRQNAFGAVYLFNAVQFSNMTCTVSHAKQALHIHGFISSLPPKCIIIIIITITVYR